MSYEKEDIIKYILWYRNVLKYLRSPSQLVGSLGMLFFFLVIIGFGLNNPVLVPEMDGEEITDIRVEYPDDFASQMLYYSKEYGNL